MKMAVWRNVTIRPMVKPSHGVIHVIDAVGFLPKTVNTPAGINPPRIFNDGITNASPLVFNILGAGRISAYGDGIVVFLFVW